MTSSRRKLWLATSTAVALAIGGACSAGEIGDGARDDGGAGASGTHAHVTTDGGEILDASPPMGAPWSDAKSWPSGKVPQAGDDVVIPRGTNILLDVSPPALGDLEVEGGLAFAEKDLDLRAKRIVVMGKLQIGNSGRLFEQHASITLTDTDRDRDEDATGTRGIIVMGQLELHGKAPLPTWTKLAATADAGAKSLELLADTSWQAGDELIVASTDFFRLGADDAAVVKSAAGSTVQLQAPLSFEHWGVLQYADAKGMTLTKTTSVSPRVLDERAEVGNLSRTITIAGADDDAWRDQRYGAHVMVHAGGVAHVQGVRFERVGQAGLTGRYPMHFHLLSYETDGSVLPDAEGQYLKDSVIVHSAQRCVVIHGTNGLTISGNICHDIRGHAFFLEDAVERRNLLEHNLVVGVKEPLAAETLMNHEKKSFRRGPSGFWLTNPDNIVRDNAVASSAGNGYWLAYPDKPLNLLKSVSMQPRHLPFGVFDDNSAHSNAVSGLMFDLIPTNDAGDTAEAHYIPFQGGIDNGDFGAHLPFTMSRFTSYKHELANGGDGPFWNRARKATFQDFVLADFDGVGFKGASQLCLINGALVVGTSLNAAHAAGGQQPPEGAASYHSECRIEDNVFVNLPAVPNQRGGAFATDDYYMRGVDKGLTFNGRNTLINTHPGYRVPSPNVLGTEAWALAGALWDPHGYWGPASYYWVYDLPFLTAGTSCQAVKQKVHDDDVVCEGPYYDVGVPLRDHEDMYDPAHEYRALRVERVDNTTVWEIPQGVAGNRLVNMRRAALVKGGEYVLRTPGTTPGHSVDLGIDNVQTSSDSVLLAFEYDGTKTPVGYVTSWINQREVTTWSTWTKWKANDASYKTEMRAEFWLPLTAAASKSAVAGGSGGTYFQDAANDLIWILVRRQGIADPGTNGKSLYGHLTYVFDDAL